MTYLGTPEENDPASERDDKRVYFTSDPSLYAKVTFERILSTIPSKNRETFLKYLERDSFIKIQVMFNSLPFRVEAQEQLGNEAVKGRQAKNVALPSPRYLNPCSASRTARISSKFRGSVSAMWSL